MRKFFAIFLILLLLVSNLCGCSLGGKEDTIRIGYHTNYGGSGAVLIGVEKGFFEEEGLNVELVAFASGPPEISALNNGTIDFAYIGQGSHSLIVNGMGEIVCLQNISDAEAIVTRVSSGIASLEDLQGKTIAVLFGTSSEDTVNVALQSVGLATSDVTLVNYDMAGAVTALKNGEVDVACVWEEYRFQAIEVLGDDGLVLATTGDFSDTYVPLSSWVATSDYIDENPETVQKFVNAIIKSQDYWAYNTEETCNIISSELNISLENLLLGKDLTNLFTIVELEEFLQTDYIYELYALQQEYLLTTYEGISPRSVSGYVHMEFMENAIAKFNEE